MEEQIEKQGNSDERERGTKKPAPLAKNQLIREARSRTNLLACGRGLRDDGGNRTEESGGKGRAEGRRRKARRREAQWEREWSGEWESVGAVGWPPLPARSQSVLPTCAALLDFSLLFLINSVD